MEVLRQQALQDLKPYFHNRKITRQVEKGIYHFACHFCTSVPHYEFLLHSVYSDKVRDILFNIQQNGSDMQSILQQINDGQMEGQLLATLKREALNSGQWKMITDRQNRTDETLNNLETVTWKPCKFCKGTEYFFHQEQVRSMDEPMTSFYQCKSCPRRYVFNN